MIEIDAHLKGKSFALYNCSPLKGIHGSHITKVNIIHRARSLANFIVSTGRFRLADHFEESKVNRTSSGQEDKRIISLVQFSSMEIPFKTGTSTSEEKMIMYRINIGIGSENDATFMEFYLLPSMAEDVSKRDARFGYYPVLLCKASTEISLYVREWLQSFFDCKITKCAANTQLLVNLVSWWGNVLHDISIEGAEDDLEILRTKEDIRLEYCMGDISEIQKVTVGIGPIDLVKLQISARETDNALIDEIELYVLKHASINIGALSLNRVTTNSVALHMDGKLKFSANASDGLVLAILYDLVKSFEEGNDTLERGPSSGHEEYEEGGDEDEEDVEEEGNEEMLEEEEEAGDEEMIEEVEVDEGEEE